MVKFVYYTTHIPRPTQAKFDHNRQRFTKTSQTHPMNKRASRPTTETYRTDRLRFHADKRRKETQTTRLPTWKVESAATKILTPKSRRKLIAPKMLHQAPRKAENDHKKYNSADPETHFPHATKIYPAATM